jgi:hypothetical protein
MGLVLVDSETTLFLNYEMMIESNGARTFKILQGLPHEAPALNTFSRMKFDHGSGPPL